MTLLEAIKSGRPYKRQGSSRYYPAGKNPSTSFTMAAVMADDWEIQEETITVTKTSLLNALTAVGIISEQSRGLFLAKVQVK